MPGRRFAAPGLELAGYVHSGGHGKLLHLAALPAPPGREERAGVPSSSAKY
jgi:hypothetical protein